MTLEQLPADTCEEKNFGTYNPGLQHYVHYACSQKYRESTRNGSKSGHRLRSIADLATDFARSSRRHCNHQRLLLPQSEDSLIRPISALSTKLHIEVQHHGRQDKTHFVPRKVLYEDKSAKRFQHRPQVSAKLTLPKQFLGPTLNGSTADSWSSLNSGSPSQRSGWNSCGFLKYSGLLYVDR
jgi:hypothetical protein